MQDHDKLLDERETSLLSHQPVAANLWQLVVHTIFEQIKFDILNLLGSFASDLITQKGSSKIVRWFIEKWNEYLSAKGCDILQDFTQQDVPPSDIFSNNDTKLFSLSK
jgi:hypothetical protein